MRYCFGSLVVACLLVGTAAQAQIGDAQNPKVRTLIDGDPIPKHKAYRVIKDGKVIYESDQPPPKELVNPQGGRHEFVKRLLEGDAETWLILLGVGVTLLVAYFVALYLRDRKKAQPTAAGPAQVAHSWQKQRALTLTSSFVGLPVGVILAVIIGLALESTIAAIVPLLAVVFVCVVISMVNWRCPACGGDMGRNWNPGFCPKCGVQLQETQRPTQGSSAVPPSPPEDKKGPA